MEIGLLCRDWIGIISFVVNVILISNVHVPFCYYDEDSMECK